MQTVQCFKLYSIIEVQASLGDHRSRRHLEAVGVILTSYLVVSGRWSDARKACGLPGPCNNLGAKVSQDRLLAWHNFFAWHCCLCSCTSASALHIIVHLPKYVLTSSKGRPCGEPDACPVTLKITWKLVMRRAQVRSDALRVKSATEDSCSSTHISNKIR